MFILKSIRRDGSNLVLPRRALENLTILQSDEWPTQDVENDPWAVYETQAEPEFKDASVKSPPNGKKTPLKDKKAAGEKKVPRERKPLGRKSNAASKKPENTVTIKLVIHSTELHLTWMVC